MSFPRSWPRRRFTVVLADPPWQYSDRTPRGGAEHHYRTMSERALVRLPVDELAADDAALFLWATWPLLPVALRVMQAWGFEYRNCAFAWVKTTSAGSDAVGLGHYTRGNTEPCLLGLRGRLKRRSAAVRQVVLEQLVAAPRQAHSAKPRAVRDRIVELLGEVPRVELFARERARGWTSWGDQLHTGRVK
jgi:N6-adenosine-specific RNA methylase IME4